VTEIRPAGAHGSDGSVLPDRALNDDTLAQIGRIPLEDRAPYAPKQRFRSAIGSDECTKGSFTSRPRGRWKLASGAERDPNGALRPRIHPGWPRTCMNRSGPSKRRRRSGMPSTWIRKRSKRSAASEPGCCRACAS